MRSGKGDARFSPDERNPEVLALSFTIILVLVLALGLSTVVLVWLAPNGADLIVESRRVLVEEEVSGVLA